MLNYARIFVKCQNLFRKLSIYSQRKHSFDFIGWWIFKVLKWNRRRFSLKGNRWNIGNGNGRLDKHQINICVININDLEYGRTKKSEYIKILILIPHLTTYVKNQFFFSAFFTPSFVFDSTLTRPIGLPPHAPVAQKNCGSALTHR